MEEKIKILGFTVSLRRNSSINQYSNSSNISA